MSIQKAISHIDVYRLRALSGNLKALSGRASSKQTDVINKFILSKIPSIQESSVVVDIGCGDGSLLALFSATLRLGIVPTEEEKNLLDAHFQKKLDIQIGRAENLDLDNDFADVVILSGVIILLREKSAVSECLKEVRRVTKRQAWVYIGDVPELDEAPDYGDSIIKYLIFLNSNNGLTRVFQELLKLFRATIGLESYIVKPKKVFHMIPVDFVELCQSLGFNVVEYGKQPESSTRWYYILESN